jgi:hypothetical protein
MKKVKQIKRLSSNHKIVSVILYDDIYEAHDLLSNILHKLLQI